MRRAGVAPRCSTRERRDVTETIAYEIPSSGDVDDRGHHRGVRGRAVLGRDRVLPLLPQPGDDVEIVVAATTAAHHRERLPPCRRANESLGDRVALHVLLAAQLIDRCGP